MDQETTRIQNAQVGYQAAVNLWTCEGQLVWARFNAMLVTNSILVALLGTMFDKDNFPKLLLLLVPILGLLQCVVWFLFTKRGFDYFAYWITSARELEEEHLKPTVVTVSRGKSFGSGLPVEIKNSSVLRMSKWSSLFTVQHLAHLVIASFAVIYVVAFYYATQRFFGDCQCPIQ